MTVARIMGQDFPLAVRPPDSGERRVHLTPSLRPYIEVIYQEPPKDVTSRIGVDSHWTYGPMQSYGGGATSQVNLTTGNLVVQQVSTTIPARGFDVSIVHTYNSQDTPGALDETQDAAASTDPADYFGAGWTMSYNIRLLEYNSGNSVRLKDGTGRSRIYTKVSDTADTRTYIHPLYYGFTLTKDLSSPAADKVFTLTADQGLTQYFFDADGKLTKIQDRPNGNGNYLAFTYTSGKLTRITDL
ncbi:MAG: DUF6531 domain-containing protein [Chloroflexi bacterium]|nr:DUF6531 domain-containing protein [Chloroflexota bacterium]